MRKLVVAASLVLIASLMGCEAGRRFYLSATRQIVRNMTGSMLPTIKEKQFVVIDRDFYTKHPIGRFDIVVVKDPQGSKNENGTDAYFIKRVIGLPGETIEIRGGQSFINGSPLNETFSTVTDDSHDNFAPYTIPQGEYFLLGDNRPNSADSRYWDRHSVSKNLIYAKVVELLSD